MGCHTVSSICGWGKIRFFNKICGEDTPTEALKTLTSAHCNETDVENAGIQLFVFYTIKMYQVYHQHFLIYVIAILMTWWRRVLYIQKSYHLQSTQLSNTACEHIDNAMIGSLSPRHPKNKRRWLEINRTGTRTSGNTQRNCTRQSSKVYFAANAKHNVQIAGAFAVKID